MHAHSLELRDDVTLLFQGPPLDVGPLPALFYFTLSAEDSLLIDPYNQPAAFLSSYPMRIFSIDLPHHGKGLSALDAMEKWATDILHGNDTITAFIEKMKFAIHELIHRHVIKKEALGICGLSRGAFMATHVAAKVPEISAIVGFAPLTQLTFAKEFANLKDEPIARSLNLENCIPSLIGKSLRFYIGNRDIRVGTAHCFHFIEKLADASFHHRIRSAPVELIIGPSIGHMGHGTSNPAFQDGAKWLAHKLGVSNV